MPIDPQKEKLYALRDLIQFIPTRRGRRIHRSAVFRWAKYGLRRGDKAGPVLLEVVVAGGSLASSREALNRFFAELTRRASLPNASAVSASIDDPAPAGSSDRSNVDRQLDDLGF